MSSVSDAADGEARSGAIGTPKSLSLSRIGVELTTVQVAPTVLLMGLFLTAPLALMVCISFLKTSIFGLELTPSLYNYQKFVSDPLFAALLLKSLRIAATVTVAVLLVSFPMSFWLAKRVDRWKPALLLLVFAPYWVSYVIRTYAWMPLLGRTGVINQLLISIGLIEQPLDMLLFNEFSVQLVMIYVFLPFAIIPIYLSLERIDDNLLRASSDLGASPAATLWNVILPLSAPGLAGAFLTVFVLAIGSYVTPKLLGGPNGIMLGNVIADQFGASFNWSWGATLSLVLVLATMLLVVAINKIIPLQKVFLQP